MVVAAVADGDDINVDDVVAVDDVDDTVDIDVFDNDVVDVDDDDVVDVDDIDCAGGSCRQEDHLAHGRPR